MLPFCFIGTVNWWLAISNFVSYQATVLKSTFVDCINPDFRHWAAALLKIGLQLLKKESKRGDMVLKHLGNAQVPLDDTPSSPNAYLNQSPCTAVGSIEGRTNDKRRRGPFISRKAPGLWTPSSLQETTYAVKSQGQMHLGVATIV